MRGIGFDLAQLSPVLIERNHRGARGNLMLTLAKKGDAAQLSKSARLKFRSDCEVEYLGSDKHPDVIAIRETPKGTKYGVPLSKNGSLPIPIGRMLRSRGWQVGRHEAEWRDGALIVWRNTGDNAS